MPPPVPAAAAETLPPTNDTQPIDPNNHDDRDSTLYIMLPSVLFCVGFAALTLCVLGWKFGWCARRRRLRAAQNEAGDLIREDREERRRMGVCIAEAGMEERGCGREEGMEEVKKGEMVEEVGRRERERRKMRWKERLEDERRRSLQGLTKPGATWDGF